MLNDNSIGFFWSHTAMDAVGSSDEGVPRTTVVGAKSRLLGGHLEPPIIQSKQRHPPLAAKSTATTNRHRLDQWPLIPFVPFANFSRSSTCATSRPK